MSNIKSVKDQRYATKMSASGRQSSPIQGMTPSQQDIARRAYEIYLRNGRRPGRDEQNWLDAERELLSQG